MKIGEAIEGLRSFLRQMTAYPQILRQLEAQLEAQQVWIDELEAELKEERYRHDRRWIPAGKDLPKRNGRYLCRYQFGEESYITFIQVLDYYATDMVPHFQHTLGEENMIVTHWAHLPEEPEEDD